MNIFSKYRTIRNWIVLLAVSISCGSQSQSTPEHQVVQPMSGKELLTFTTPVRSFLEDSKGNIWFGSDREGVCLLQNGRFRYFTTADGLSDNQVRNIYEDVNGMIWFECGTGLSMFDGKKIAVYKQRNYDAVTLWKAGPDDLWFKGDETVGYNSRERNSGVYQYDGKTLSFREFPIANQSDEERRFQYSISTSFFRGKHGTIWFGAYKALIGYNGESFKILTDQSLGLDGKTSSLHIRGFLEDRNGKLWIANNGKGVLIYNGKQTVNFTVQHKLTKADTGGYSLDRAYSIGEDAEGTIWIGTVESGLWRYDGKTITNYTDKDGLGGLFIPAMYKSKQGDMWFGGNGVYRFTGKSFERIY